MWTRCQSLTLGGVLSSAMSLCILCTFIYDLLCDISLKCLLCDISLKCIVSRTTGYLKVVCLAIVAVYVARYVSYMPSCCLLLDKG